MKRKEPAEVEAMLEELRRAASELGLEVREEEILREVGYRARSGVCRVGDRTVVVLDRRLSGRERIDILCGALAGRDFERVFLSPALRARLAAAGGSSPASGGPATTGG
jgi:hypothetical protein